MTHPDNRRALRARIAAGLAAGIAVAAVDDLSIGGEVGPIVIVGMLLAASAAAGAPWGHRGAMAAAILWACLPLSHVGKHVLNMPDTLHPNTFASILNLAAFSLVVAAIGTGIGLLLHSFRCTEGSTDAQAQAEEPTIPSSLVRAGSVSRRPVARLAGAR